jgi:hypothetical protein
MPEPDAGTAAILVLTQEIGADRESLDRHVSVARHALATAPWPAESPMLSVVAVALHHYYGAAESIFERVARAFEGAPARSDRWHQELLDRMTFVLEDVRPAVLRRETARALSPVLGFRHFFRHAYAVAFDARRLQLAVEDAVRSHALLSEDLDAFERTLRAAARPPSPG